MNVIVLLLNRYSRLFPLHSALNIRHLQGPMPKAKADTNHPASALLSSMSCKREKEEGMKRLNRIHFPNTCQKGVYQLANTMAWALDGTG